MTTDETPIDWWDEFNLPAIIREWGSAIRGDWSDFDGRTGQGVMEEFADWIEGKDLPKSMKAARDRLNLCLAGEGHWCGTWGHCEMYECECDGWHGWPGEESRWFGV